MCETNNSVFESLLEGRAFGVSVRFDRDDPFINIVREQRSQKIQNWYPRVEVV
jgi:hypothetical protein